MSDSLTIVSCNFQDNGGGDLDKWQAMYDLLAGLRPDILLMQEMTSARDNGAFGMFAAERRLSTHGPMRGFIGGRVQGDRPTAVFIRTDVLEPLQNRQHAYPWWVPPTDLSVRLVASRIPLRIASVHLCHFSPEQRLTEAQWLTTLNDDPSTWGAIVGGDFNSFPEAGDDIPPPDWDTVVDRPHITHRTVLSSTERVNDDRPDRTLLRAGFRDAARVAFENYGTPLEPTAGPENQGGKRRIDRVHLSEQIAPGVSDVAVVDSEGLSDHAIVVVRLATSIFAEVCW